MQNPDLLIVGAGPVGCVVAERTARLLGWKCLVIDKRNHHAGNCFDTTHLSGVRIHRYGPHYFRTNKKQIVDYLSEFTGWVPGNYIVKCMIAMVVFGKRLLALLAPTITMLSFHMWVHAETRYTLAIHPYLLIFSLLALCYLWGRVVRKIPAQQIEKEIFAKGGQDEQYRC